MTSLLITITLGSYKYRVAIHMHLHNYYELSTNRIRRMNVKHVWQRCNYEHNSFFFRHIFFHILVSLWVIITLQDIHGTCTVYIVHVMYVLYAHILAITFTKIKWSSYFRLDKMCLFKFSDETRKTADFRSQKQCD